MTRHKKTGIIHVQMYVGNVFNQGGHKVAGTEYYIITIVSVFHYYYNGDCRIRL